MAAPNSDTPSGEWVPVLDTSNRIQLAMAKGLLEDAGIGFLARGDIGTLLQDLNGFLYKRVQLQVPREREAEARQILEQVIEPVPGA